MNLLLLSLLLAVGVIAFAGWRLVAARRARGAARGRPDSAYEPAVEAARPAATPVASGKPATSATATRPVAPARPVAKPVATAAPATSAPASAAAPTGALAPGLVMVDGKLIPERRSAARLQADRVIAAEAARRQAALPGRDALLRAASERRAAKDAAQAAVQVAARHDPAPARPAAAPASTSAVVLPLPAHAPAPAPAAVADAPLAPVVALRTAAPRAAKTPQQTLVLVVDDSKMVRLKTGKLLAAHGYQVAQAVDGQDAVRLVETQLPDLVVTDVDMPNLDGFALARHLRANARTAHVPIVMITSAEDRHRDEATRAGVGLVLGKPYPEDELLAHVASFAFPAASGREAAAGAIA